jgi:signal transduction histidine kinase
MDQYNFDSIDLDYYLMDILDELSFDYRSDELKIEYHRPQEKPLFVNLDVLRFNRVIMNIVKNSAKYAQKPNVIIEVSVTKVAATKVRISFKDNGMGSNEGDLKFLFESFTRGDQSRNPNEGGSGLGLAIAETIVSKHHGSIWANSNYGDDFEIVIELPIEGSAE